MPASKVRTLVPDPLSLTPRSRRAGIGRPSIAKCKALKAKRDLQAEVDALDTSVVVSGKRRTRTPPDW